jgi:FAD:protein FMN transferase
MSAPQTFAYESMGTHWAVSVWDPIGTDALQDLERTVVTMSQEFDRTYSRFIRSSLVWELTTKKGIVEVPEDLTEMLRIYEKLYVLSGGKVNPLVGFALSDLGYDAEYSLKPKENVRPVPTLADALVIKDARHLELKESVLIDLGALGKGYFVDRISDFLLQKGIRRFLVNGSGDIYYRGDGHTLRAGLEHPANPAKVIGVLEMKEGALCASSGNRRRWGKHHHTIDPESLTSPETILASWVHAESAVLADGLCTCLLLTEPERYAPLQFEYCLLNPEYKIKRSAGFTAELF